MSESDLSRRDFMRIGALGAAGAVVAACQPEVIRETVKETVEVAVQQTVEVEVPVEQIVEVEVPVEQTVVVEATPTPMPNAPDPGVDINVNNLFSTQAEFEELTGETIDSYQESPMMAEMVANGELPPVEERLPEEPAVIRTWQVGQFGGEVRVLGNEFLQEMEQEPFEIKQTWNFRLRMHAKFCKGWALAEDGKSLTLFMRKGHKWSDGVEITAEDWRFWYEDMLMDPDLVGPPSQQWIAGGELMGFNVIDDYTFEYTFAVPKYNAVEVFRDTGGGRGLVEPAHYLKKFHLKYNPDAEALAAEEGYDSWQDMFNNKRGNRSYQRDPEYPSASPWVIEEVGPTSKTWVRNPYYFRVDSAGNQQPYIDRVFEIVTDDPYAIAPIKVMAGEIDYGRRGLTLQDYAVLKQNEEAGGYKVYLWQPRKLDTSSAVAFAFNYSTPDLVLREIVNDLRFRQALSLAINRAEISKSVYFGLTEPWTASFMDVWPGYEDWMGTHFAEYDVERANALLDEMGLEWDADGEYRLRPDGQRLFILGEWAYDMYDIEEVLDLVVLHWKEVGVQLEPKFVARSTLVAAGIANENTLYCGSTDRGDEIRRARAAGAVRLQPPYHWYRGPGVRCCPFAGYNWRLWHITGGEEGVEPPEVVKHLFELHDEWMSTPFVDLPVVGGHGPTSAHEWENPDAAQTEYDRLINEILTLNAENMWMFGTVSAPPDPWIVNDRMGGAAGEMGPEFGLHHFYTENLFYRE